MFQEIVESLRYLTDRTRPDLAFSVGVLGRHMHNPNSEHLEAAKRVLRYIKGTRSLGILYSGSGGDNTCWPVAYCDSDYAGDPGTRRSTSGHVFMLAGGAVSWQSRLQNIVTLSSCEAEYAALTEAIREALWIRSLMLETGLFSEQAITIHEDNQSAIALSKNHSNSTRSKHIDVRNYFCREQAAIGHILIKYIQTNDQVADGLTKPLTSTKLEAHLKHLNLRNCINDITSQN